MATWTLQSKFDADFGKLARKDAYPAKTTWISRLQETIDELYLLFNSDLPAEHPACISETCEGCSLASNMQTICQSRVSISCMQLMRM